MKRIAATLFLVCSCIIAIAQNSNILKFLDIPIDGSELSMKNKLKQKGFKEKYGYDCLTGQFNGETVDVYIHTNHQKVDRIYVAFRPTTEHEIRIKYNRLLAQFDNNDKYSGSFYNAEIPMDEDIEYEISANHKRYEATFHYINPGEDISEEDILERFYTALSSTWPEDKISNLKTQFANFLNLSEEEKELRLSEIKNELAYNSKFFEENAEILDNHPELLTEYYEQMFGLLQAAESVFDSMTIGSVWFMIHREYKGKYYIGLYYDNLANRPNGEDL